MSELVNARDANIRKNLLATASALALVAYIAATDTAKAENTARPTVWIDLGGQMETVQGVSSPLSAPFMGIVPDPGSYDLDIFSRNQRPARFAFGFEGALNFSPENSNWVFMAGIRYGRSHTRRHEHRQGEQPIAHKYNRTTTVPVYARPFADVAMKYAESHTILDFKAGRDVGVGAFGPEGLSTIGIGIRYADFSLNSDTQISARPHIGYAFRPRNNRPFATFYQYFQTGHFARSFHGIGPSLSWNASAALAGNADAGELTFDWGANAALLFGRQKAKTAHGTQAYHLTQQSRRRSGYPLAYPTRSYHDTRARSVTTPNLGAFAGLSLRKRNAKVSFGYRADFFFRAVDTGIDARHTKDLGFYGPYATISIGLGG